MRFFIYELDKRQKAIGEFLKSSGYTKVTYSEIENADIIVLPFSNVEQNVNINNDFLERLKKDVKVFTGFIDYTLREKFESKNMELIEFLNMDETAILNSVPTAEGVIYHLIGGMGKCIFNSSILVIGFGICGNAIVEKLKLLGANVDIMEISKEKIGNAKIHGIKIVDENRIHENYYDAIINTVPTKIITRSTLENINNSTMIFDIASYPYGFDNEELKDIGLFYSRLNNLPSKFGVEFSGEIMGQQIIKNI